MIKTLRQFALQNNPMHFLPLLQVPEILSSMVQLEELLIDGNKIKILPNFLGNFSKLRHLDASFNQLEVICPEIGHCSNLVDLTLSSNDLKVGGYFANVMKCIWCEVRNLRSN